MHDEQKCQADSSQPLGNKNLMLLLMPSVMVGRNLTQPGRCKAPFNSD